MSLILLRGGGDLASGVALRLVRAGLNVVIAELASPLTVRRTVAFAEAVYEGQWSVEGITATRVSSLADAISLARAGGLPVVVAPDIGPLVACGFTVIIDARMTKREADTDVAMAPLVIGLGPGFEAGRHCHAVVETQRGPTLGRVHWLGTVLPDTGQPTGDVRRVLRSPADGPLIACAEIGQIVEAGSVVATVADHAVVAPFRGVLRGLIRPGVTVTCGLKIGDVDARSRPELCWLVSDKALAVAGGVMEALLARAQVRARLWV